MRQTDSKGYIQYNSVYVTFWKRQKYQDTEQISDCQMWHFNLRLITEDPRDLLQLVATVVQLIMVVVKQLVTFVKNARNRTLTR